jgi:16S rRNA (adenine1518-N6/adenine1519-N6)-dimethyltransferase
MKHRPRKRFGQHFLVESGVVDAIVRAIDPRVDDALVEIGPGLGALTGPLSQRCRRLTVVELDRDLAARWRSAAQVRVIEADALRVDFAQLASDAAKPLRVVGNLPYNISTPILFHLLDAVSVVEDQHFMLQKEVVDRMAASPGGKAYGRLSVMLQWRYDIERLFDVAPTAFDPPPAVNSAVVRMVPRPGPSGLDVGLLRELVTVSFSQRRKLIRHTLGRWLERAALDLPFDLQRRAEEVSVQEFVGLAQLATARGLRANESGGAEPPDLERC